MIRGKSVIKSNWLPYLIIFLVLLIGIVVYLAFFKPITCAGYECFQEAMGGCRNAVYVNEEPEATWRYRIEGLEGDYCNIEVKLLQAKQGELGIGQLKGYSMECSYPRGVATYPDKDLGKCHGRLKEELQNLIINKLHQYIIENLGKFDEALNKAV